MPQFANLNMAEFLHVSLCCFFEPIHLISFHLRYHPMGCKEAFPLAKKSAHERDCPFLQLKCPFHGQCAFNGALADVVPHLAAEHQVPNLAGNSKWHFLSDKGTDTNELVRSDHEPFPIR